MLVLALAATVGGCAGASTAVVDDGEVDSRVTARLSASPSVHTYEIDPDTIDGIVTLRGEVDSSTQKLVAEQITRNTEGVDDVDNQLMIKNDRSRDQVKAAVDNAMVEDAVSARLVGDPVLRRFRIDVEAQDGLVILDGAVPDERLRKRAEKLATKTRGVERVLNQLRVGD